VGAFEREGVVVVEVAFREIHAIAAKEAVAKEAALMALREIRHEAAMASL
jgi:uncharacterized protein YkuJ